MAIFQYYKNHAQYLGFQYHYWFVPIFLQVWLVYRQQWWSHISAGALSFLIYLCACFISRSSLGMVDPSLERFRDCLGTNGMQYFSCWLSGTNFPVEILLFSSWIYRDTAVGKLFFSAVATKESVRNILCQVLLWHY